MHHGMRPESWSKIYYFDQVDGNVTDQITNDIAGSLNEYIDLLDVNDIYRDIST